MLILTRFPGETLMIGEDVTVTVLGAGGALVKLGIEAPRSMNVDREEIWLKKQMARETGAVDRVHRESGS